MVVIDSHIHLGMFEGQYFGAEKVLSEMDRNGIDKAVVSSVELSGKNDEIYEEVKKAKGRFTGFVRVDPKEGEIAVKEIEMRVKKQGFKGIKLHPMFQSFSMISEVVFPIYEVAKKLKVPVILHSGAEIYNTPSQFALAAEIYPKVTFIMSHMGQYLLVEEAILVAKRRENIILDATATGFSVSYIKKAVKAIGAERIINGSDIPFLNQRFGFEKLELVGLAEDELRLIKGDTMESILKRVPNYW